MNGPFQGVATAMVTPFYKNSVDFDCLQQLIERQIESGVNALVFLGSTGESHLLNGEERRKISRFAVDTVKGKIPVGLGCGENTVQGAIESAKRAEEAGADFLLCVTPSYIKCTQDGLLLYYRSVSSAVQIPVIAYNVPSRTGVDLLPETIEKIPALAGVKDASGKVDRLTQFPETLYCGDDLLTLPYLSLGALGTISVLSNICPKTAVRLHDLFFLGKIKQAVTLAKKLSPLCRALSLEVNPIPVKETLRLIGFPVGPPRAPLLCPEKKTRKKLLECVQELQKDGLLV